MYVVRFASFIFFEIIYSGFRLNQSKLTLLEYKHDFCNALDMLIKHEPTSNNESYFIIICARIVEFVLQERLIDW